MHEVSARDLTGLLADFRERMREPGTLFLIGATSQLYAGWRSRVAQLDLAGEGRGLEAAARAATEERGTALVWEHPGDVIPLPPGHENRARPTGASWPVPGGTVAVVHFDPCSVVFRAIARGDAPDYEVALAYLSHDWVRFDELDTLLAETLPRFTSETIQQDPAEFRRKLRGLRQMWLATAARERRQLDGPPTRS